MKRNFLSTQLCGHNDGWHHIDGVMLAIASPSMTQTNTCELLLSASSAQTSPFLAAAPRLLLEAHIFLLSFHLSISSGGGGGGGTSLLLLYLIQFRRRKDEHEQPAPAQPVHPEDGIS